MRRVVTNSKNKPTPASRFRVYTPPNEGVVNLNTDDVEFRGRVDFTNAIVVGLPDEVPSAYTLPLTDGDAGQVLQTDGDGVVTWEDISGGDGNGIYGGSGTITLGAVATMVQRASSPFPNPSFTIQYANGDDALSFQDKASPAVKISTFGIGSDRVEVTSNQVQMYTANGGRFTVGGTGTVNFGTFTISPLGGSDPGEIRILTAAAQQTITIKTPVSVSSNYTLTLPPNDGSANQVLTTDGSGVTTWEDAAGAAYLSYTALLAFSGSSNPTATIISNDLSGPIV